LAVQQTDSCTTVTSTELKCVEFDYEGSKETCNNTCLPKLKNI